MYIDKVFGPVMPEQGWVPAPSYSMRRKRVLELSKAWPAGSMLEVGCGAGTLLHEFALRGFDCLGLDDSKAARELAVAVNRGVENVRVSDSPSPDWSAEFDYLLALEVLEHIEHDLSALRQWYRWLKPGGCLLMSVPAHMSRWSASDTWAGHYRRYERDPLKELLDEAGYRLEVFESYGFPIANMVEPLRAFHHSRALKKASQAGAEVDRESLNQQSGVSRSLEAKLFPVQRSIAGKLVFKLGFAMQSWTARTELGTGYLALARRPLE